jgi:glutamine amidotransferase
MIAIVDLGVGNLANVRKALGGVITSDPYDIDEADKIVLPGVGSFGAAAKRLNPLKKPILKGIEEGRPFLGICLGMQLLFEYSEEGEGKGLGVFKGNVVRFKDVKTPHIGWNQVFFTKECPLFDGLKSGSHFYFVHSYHVNPAEDIIVAYTDYGTNFPSAVYRNNVFGVQFHPEKSGRNGLKLLANFKRL